MYPAPARTRRLLAACAAALLAASPAAADVLRLTDGTTYTGTVARGRGGWVVTLADGRRVEVPTEKVAGVEGQPKANVADDRLASLRRWAATSNDAKAVVDRYRAFVIQYLNTPAADQARADLTVWEDRIARQLVRVGDQWLSAEERQQAAAKSFTTAEQAMDLLAANRAVEAAPIIDRAIAENANNAAAWYLKGLAALKGDHLPEARKAFERVLELLPDHVPSLHNLAVALWRQNQHVAALLSYDKALSAAPGSRIVLDAMAEALAALPVELRDRTTVGRVVRHFNEQEAVVVQQMAARGLFRWGSTWVSREQLDRLHAGERDVAARIAQLEAQYNDSVLKTRRLDDDIAAEERAMRSIEAGTVVVDASGRVTRYPLPAAYQTHARTLAALQAERQQRADEQSGLKRQAQQLAQGTPTPRYTGQQRPIECEGTPVLGQKLL
ncbi:MAG TPA: tetratricopeptide repeat protein, partial [Humisphaera sp.]